MNVKPKLKTSAKMVRALLDEAGADDSLVALLAEVDVSLVSYALRGERNGHDSQFARGVIAGLTRKRKSELWTWNDSKATKAAKPSLGA